MEEENVPAQLVAIEAQVQAIYKVLSWVLVSAEAFSILHEGNQ